MVTSGGSEVERGKSENRGEGCALHLFKVKTAESNLRFQLARAKFLVSRTVSTN